MMYRMSCLYLTAFFLRADNGVSATSVSPSKGQSANFHSLWPYAAIHIVAVYNYSLLFKDKKCVSNF